MIFDTLLGIPLFQGLTLESLREAISTAPLNFSKYRANDNIAVCGDSFDEVVFILSGRVRSVTEIYNKEISITEDFEAPQNLPFFFLFGPETKYPNTITALCHVSTMSIKKDKFLEILMKDKVLMINLMNIMSNLAQRHLWAMDSIGEQQPQQRLASWLLALSSQPARSIAFTSKEETWLRMLGLDKKDFHDAIDFFAEKKWIEYEDGEIRLTDRYQLKAYFQ